MIFNPAHPGEVLKDYLGDMTVKEVASRLRVTRATLSGILKEMQVLRQACRCGSQLLLTRRRNFG